MRIFFSLLLLGMCPCVVSVVMWSSLVYPWGCRGTPCGCGGWCHCDACTVVCAACVYVERVWGCEGDDNAGVGDGGGVVVVNAGRVGGRRGSGIVSGAPDVLEMRVGWVGEGCICLARAAWVEWVEWMRGLGLGFTTPVGTGDVLDMCLCLGCGDVSGVVGELVGGLDQGMEGVVLCLCELWVRILCEEGGSRYLYIVLGGNLRILGTPSMQSCCTLAMAASCHVLFMAYISIPDLCVWLSDLDLSRHHLPLWGAAPVIQRVRMAGLPKRR